MARRTINFDTVRNIGLALPGVEDEHSVREPGAQGAWKTPGVRPHASLGRTQLACRRVDFDDRAELLAADPDVYYVTEHYVGYTAVLVRLSRVDPDVLRDLLGMAYKFVTRNAAPRSPARKRN